MPGIFNAKSTTGHDLPAIDAGGMIRLLAALPSGKQIRPRLFGSGAPAATIPRSSWKPFRRVRSEVPILNQGQHGSCVGHGSASGVMLTRSAAGMTFRKLSPTWIYAHINGGRDAGSAPSDAVNFLEKTGTCLFDECGEDQIFLRQIPNPDKLTQTASRFKISNVYQIDGEDFDQRVSAVLMGFYLIDCVCVGGNFNDLDKHGVPPVTRGPGNHCVCGGEGLVDVGGGQIGIDFRQSWGQWGMDGHMTFIEAHYSHQPMCECFAVQVVSEDPEDPAALSDPIA